MFYEVPKLGKTVRLAVLTNDRMYNIDFACLSREKEVKGNPLEKFHSVISTLEIKD